MMTRDEAIAKWKSEPEKNWIIGSYQRGEKCCAIGHITEGFTARKTFMDSHLLINISDGVVYLFKNYTPEKFEKIFETSDPSDEAVQQWKDASPKQRILDAVAKGVI